MGGGLFHSHVTWQHAFGRGHSLATVVVLLPPLQVPLACNFQDQACLDTLKPPAKPLTSQLWVRVSQGLAGQSGQGTGDGGTEAPGA